MKFKLMVSILPLCLASGSVMAGDFAEGYYGSAKYLQIEQRAKEMDTSARPGVGQFVGGKEKEHLGGASVAAGYQFGNGWRTEGEYTFKQKNEYTSGSSAFPTSYNHLQTDVERLMFNVYRDYALGYGISLYGTAGLGISKIKAGGWQGTPSREFASSTQTNLTYAIGAGISYSPLERLSFDLGYRYVDMGKMESGYNNFTNARNLKDEQMKGRLVSNEFTLGVRYLF
ncbi:porin [Erwinia sp. OLTSP20]|uniref:outer membrane protein n=1 Tax=unclassified Erwinia TaxID=2622719 RepID=UPI000C17B045|nr:MULTISPECIES: outer membrane protein [unclassified Erwinia]PIJ49955.1 porin [Erwinia sp. OAMSP11]PIJ71397.1 porin [Erwinia sp. OLSSP12]PIJ80631.1 porin [Erwinia sp. OLCASP19]PIJ82772.1 porin [Erwinia sp. OLMTSP26]PIJ85458.1 porin [Erwinia sp. OLMDSP33]